MHVLNSVEKRELKNVIESLRQEMIQTGLKEGLSSHKTVSLSQKLDEYLAKYQMIIN